MKKYSNAHTQLLLIITGFIIQSQKAHLLRASTLTIMTIFPFKCRQCRALIYMMLYLRLESTLKLSC